MRLILKKLVNFWAARNSKKLNLGFFRHNLNELGLFHPYFVCKCSFRKISTIKTVILDQSKLIWLILKYQKKIFKNPKFPNWKFIIRKNWNKTRIQPILKSNSNLLCSIIFFARHIKKVIHWGVPGGYGGTVLISSWKCNYSIYLDIKIYYLDIQAIPTLSWLLLVLDVYSNTSINTFHGSCMFAMLIEVSSFW